MEGSVAEGDIHGGSYGHQIKRKRLKLKKKHASRMQRGNDASQGDISGGSERHRIKRKRVKKKGASWVLRVTGASQGKIAGGSEVRQLESKRVMKQCSSRVQSGCDASHGEIGVGSEGHLVKRKRLKKKRLSRVKRGIDASEGPMDGLSELINMLDGLDNGFDHMLARKALDFYEKSQDAEFEIVKVIYSERANLTRPNVKKFEVWRHVSFIAQPKNAAEGSDISPKYFFAELKKDFNNGSEYDATYCSTFEPSDDPGFEHGCIFCPYIQKFHPADGYSVGRRGSDWRKQRWRFV